MADMQLVSVNPNPEPATATVRVSFQDGTSILARNVIDLNDDEIMMQIRQKNGDYTMVPIEDNIKFVEVTWDVDE